jgi:hypothetical protein
VNIAFSYQGLRRLGAIDPKDDFIDNAFKQGLANRSKQGLLGDPVGDPKAKGHPDNWLVGGLHNPVHVILIFAGDDGEDVDRTVTYWLKDIGPAAELVGFQKTGRESGATHRSQRRRPSRSKLWTTHSRRIKLRKSRWRLPRPGRDRQGTD